MNNRFTFKKSVIPIEIENLSFEIPYTQSLFDLKENVIKRAERILMDLEDTTDKTEAFKQASLLFKEVLDELLGEGAYNKIFSGRKQDIIEEIDVIYYVIGQINAYEKNRYQVENQDNLVKFPQNKASKKNRKRR